MIITNLVASDVHIDSGVNFCGSLLIAKKIKKKKKVACSIGESSKRSMLTVPYNLAEGAFSIPICVPQ